MDASVEFRMRRQWLVHWCVQVAECLNWFGRYAQSRRVLDWAAAHALPETRVPGGRWESMGTLAFRQDWNGDYTFVIRKHPTENGGAS